MIVGKHNYFNSEKLQKSPMVTELLSEKTEVPDFAERFCLYWIFICRYSWMSRVGRHIHASVCSSLGVKIVGRITVYNTQEEMG